MNTDLENHDCHLSPEDSCDCVRFKEEETTMEELMDDDSDNEKPQIDDYNAEDYE